MRRIREEVKVLSLLDVKTKLKEYERVAKTSLEEALNVLLKQIFEKMAVEEVGPVDVVGEERVLSSMVIE